MSDLRLPLFLLALSVTAVHADPPVPGRARFALARTPFKAIVGPLPASDGPTLGIRGEAVQFPSAVVTKIVRNNTVHGIYLAPPRPTRRAIVLLPWFKDGDTSKLELIGRAFALGGFKVLALSMGYQFQRAPKGYGSGDYILKGGGPEHVQQWMQQAVLDARRAARWLVRERGVDAHRVGLVGISLGGFVTALTYGVAPEFKAAATVLAGGGFAPVLRTAAALRIPQVTEALERLKVTRDQLAGFCRPFDPVHYADPSKRDGLLMINGLLDPVVPYPMAHALWKAYGKPRMIRLPTGHVTSVVFVPYVLAEVLRHLRRRL